MRKTAAILAVGTLLALGATGGATGLALAGGNHATTRAEGGHGQGAGMMQGMGMMPGSADEAREMHKAHEHGHDLLQQLLVEIFC